MERKKFTILDFMKRKKEGKKFVMVSVCDYPMALLADKAGIDSILVGDALHMVALGFESTVSATMDEMILFSKAISKGAKHAFVIGDMPFMTYATVGDALTNAGRFMSEGCVDAVKLEGGEEIADKVEAIVNAGIPVMGHLGLTPQRVSMMGGFRVQGRDVDSAQRILKDALAVEKVGAFLIMLEATAKETAKMVTEKLTIPTVGIGAGSVCDGQCMVSHDLLGLYEHSTGHHAKKFAKLSQGALVAFKNYAEEVRNASWPDDEHSFFMKEGEYEKLWAVLEKDS